MSEIYYSELINVIDFRIESEYFEKRFLSLEKIIKNIETISFLEVAKMTNGRPYNSDSFNSWGGIKISKIGDVTNRREINSWEFVTMEEFDFQKGDFLKHGDILMSLTGDPPDIGKVNYVYQPQKATWNQRVAKINILNKDIIRSNEVLFSILSTEFSRQQLERYAKGIRQRNLGNESLERLRIPKLSDEVQYNVQVFTEKSFKIKELSQQKYTEAENLLLETLNLKDFQPNNEAVNIKTLKESFLQTGRLDAEFYQKKYEDYFNVISEKDYSTIGKEYVQINDRIEKFSEYNYIEIGDVNISNGESKPNIVLEENLPANAKIKVEKGDILVSKVRPYRGAVSIIEENYPNLVVSGAFTVLRPKNNSIYSAEFLKVLLRTELYKDWLLQFNVGTSYPVIKDENILNLPIPIVNENVQSQIAEYIQKANQLRAEAQSLLQEAKLSVESAIESQLAENQNISGGGGKSLKFN